MRILHGIKCGLAITSVFWLAVISACTSGCESVSVNDKEWKLPDFQPTPQDTTTTTTIPPSANELPNNLVWKGEAYGNAILEDGILRSSTVSQSTITYDATIPAAWPVKLVKVDCQAIACFGYEENGKIVIAKYDWIRKGGQSIKGAENIHKGYNGLRMPIKGTPCYSMLVSVDGKKRSKLIKTEWE